MLQYIQREIKTISKAPDSQLFMSFFISTPQLCISISQYCSSFFGKMIRIFLCTSSLWINCSNISNYIVQFRKILINYHWFSILEIYENNRDFSKESSRVTQREIRSITNNKIPWEIANQKVIYPLYQIIYQQQKLTKILFCSETEISYIDHIISRNVLLNRKNRSKLKC